MIRKTLITFGLFAGLAASAIASDVIVTVRPPHAIVETRGPSPGPGHVWIAGYHRWDGHAYVWAPGRWEMPPRPHAHWVAHRWAKRGNGWVLVEGHWR
jgi:hypothetical protein